MCPPLRIKKTSGSARLVGQVKHAAVAQTSSRVFEKLIRDKNKILAETRCASNSFHYCFCLQNKCFCYLFGKRNAFLPSLSQMTGTEASVGLGGVWRAC